MAESLGGTTDRGTWVRDNMPVLYVAATIVAGAHGERDPRLADLRLELEKFWRSAEAHPNAATRPRKEVLASLSRMRELADGFREPPWACDTYRGLLAGLQILEEQVAPASTTVRTRSDPR